MPAHAYLKRKLNKDRSPQDYYPTPPQAVDALFKSTVITQDMIVNDTWWECAAGHGHISRGLKNAGCNRVISSDIQFDIDGYGLIDFFTVNPVKDLDIHFYKRCNIITNPPYGLAQEFVERALTFPYSHIFMLLRPSFLSSMSRYNLFVKEGHNPYRVIMISKRLPVYNDEEHRKHENDIWGSGGTMDHCWVVWKRGFYGLTTMEWQTW